MRTFHRVDSHQAKSWQLAQGDKRLPIGQSIAVITGLSLLSWGAVAVMVVAARAIF